MFVVGAVVAVSLMMVRPGLGTNQFLSVWVRPGWDTNEGHAVFECLGQP